MEKIKSNFKQALLEFDKILAKEILSEFDSPKKQLQFIDEVIVDVLTEIGTSWENGELALSQVYMSGKICEELINGILPPDSTGKNGDMKLGIATLGDYHLLGKRIVYSVLKASGFNLVDYGHGIDEKALVEKCLTEKIDILLISTLMYPSALRIKNLKEGLIRNNLDIKLLVGGAPFNFDDTLWSQVGADAMGRNPTDAIKILNKWTRRDK